MIKMRRIMVIHVVCWVVRDGEMVRIQKPWSVRDG